MQVKKLIILMMFCSISLSFSNTNCARSSDFEILESSNNKVTEFVRKIANTETVEIICKTMNSEGHIFTEYELWGNRGRVKSKLVNLCKFKSRSNNHKCEKGLYCKEVVLRENSLFECSIDAFKIKGQGLTLLSAKDASYFSCFEKEDISACLNSDVLCTKNLSDNRELY